MNPGRRRTRSSFELRSKESLLSLTGCLLLLVSVFLPMLSVKLWFEPAYFVLIYGNTFLLGIAILAVSVGGAAALILGKSRAFLGIAAAGAVMTVISIFIIVHVFLEFMEAASFSFGILVLPAGAALLLTGAFMKYRKSKGN
ncbi:MAG: hypothetical protein K6B72_11525 [Lachnospiraceae bacterium]|nr:hypothetical protein [Lachnospiraceae bacterium]